MNNLRCGRFRQRLYLQAPAYPETYDTFGQPTEALNSWTTLGVFWGEVTPLRGQELVNAKQIKSQASLKIRTRWLGQGVKLSSLNRMILGDRYVATATVSLGSSLVVLSASTTIIVGSWVIFPDDVSLQAYQVTSGSGVVYSISPAYGDTGGSGLTISAARMLGLINTTNTEERDRGYEIMAYELQQSGPV